MQKQITKTIFITICLLGVFGLAQNSSAAPSVSGVDGTLTHGNSITISGTGFGTKTTATPYIWETFSDGQVDTDATIGSWNPENGTGNLTAGSNVLRPNRTTSGFANINQDNIFACFDSGTATAPSWFVSFWFYLGENFSFSDCQNDKFLRFAVPGSPQETTTAAFFGNYDVLFANEYMSGIIPSETRTGTTSDQWCYPVVGTTDSVAQLFGRGRPNYIDPAALGWRNFSTEVTIQNWHNMQYEYVEGTLNNYDGHVKIWFDGKLIFDKFILTRSTGYDHNKRPKHIGFYHAGTTNGTDNDFYISDTYVDTTRTRIELGNAPTYDGCTHREIQIPTEWDGTSVINSITATINQGSFSNGSTAYLYVVDSDGNVNSAGYPITFGTSGGDVTAPSTPSGLSVS